MSKFHRVSNGGTAASEIFDVPQSVRIDCKSDPAFTRKYGKKVKAARGRYTDVRGHCGVRYVHVPCVGNVALINAIARDCGRPGFGAQRRGCVSVVAEGIVTGYCNFQSRITVHLVAKEGEGEIFDRFLAAYHAALAGAAGGTNGVRVGSVPQTYLNYEKARQEAQEARQALPHVESALVEVALAFGEGTAHMDELAAAIAECANARTARDETAATLRVCASAFKEEAAA